MFLRSIKVMVVFINLFFVAVLANAAGITVIAPIDGVSVKSKDILIIGKTSESVKEVEISGITADGLKVKVNKGGFSAKVTLKGDKNKVTLTADDGSSLDLNISLGEKGTFSYHPDIDEVANCASTCHTNIDSVGYSINPSAPLCYDCHDANNDKAYVHGPINMGVCTVCHLPHGSNIKTNLIAQADTLCKGCHDSLMASHPNIANKSCIDCHDPHSSDKEFHIK